MDVWDYFDRWERGCADMSVDTSVVDFFEEEGSDGRRGRVAGRVYFRDDAYLAVHERVVSDGVRVERTEYAYFLVMGGEEYWGYELDPTHDPAVHRHTYGHEERLDAPEISFKEACTRAWREVSLREDSDPAGV